VSLFISVFAFLILSILPIPVSLQHSFFSMSFYIFCGLKIIHPSYFCLNTFKRKSVKNRKSNKITKIR